eukprot:Sspe_Gene.77524::Locus_48454_Transcript_1_1_Confidence_1.000_Length_2461::g.77524::m.77524
MRDFTHRLGMLREKSLAGVPKDFWRAIFLADVSWETLTGIYPIEDVRRMCSCRPENVALLVYECIEQLRNFLQLTATIENHAQVDFRSVCNSLHLLTRVVPVLFEKDIYSTHFSALFSKNSKLTPEGDSFTMMAGEPLKEPLGVILMECLVDLAFVPAFTKNQYYIPSDHPDVDGIRSSALWYGGVGPMPLGKITSWAEIEYNRITLLRCMLACLSFPLACTDVLTPNPLLEYLTRLSSPSMRTFLLSLVNTALSYDPRGVLPYTSYLNDPHEPLAVLALHILLAMLSYGDLVRAHDGATSSLISSAAAKCPNVAWQFLSGLDREEDFRVLLDRLLLLLRNPMDAANTWLPRSQKPVVFVQEVVALLWKLVDCNKAFRSFVCKATECPKLIPPLVFAMMQCKESVEHSGMLQMLVWLVLHLSSERSFAVALNKPLQEMPPVSLPAFRGTYMDLLIITFQQLIQSGVKWVRLLSDGLMTTLYNLSPYARSLSMVTASKLLNLFSDFSSYKYLSLTPDGWRNIVTLIRSLNNIIQYQYEGNIALVYAILRREDVVRRFFRLISSEPAGENDPRINESWTADVPTAVLSRLLEALKPEVDAFCSKDSVDEGEVLTFLSGITLVGLLPQPHPIDSVQFRAIPSVYAYIDSWIYTLVYMRHTEPSLWDPRSVALFPIHVVDNDGNYQPLREGVGSSKRDPSSSDGKGEKGAPEGDSDSGKAAEAKASESPSNPSIAPAQPPAQTQSPEPVDKDSGEARDNTVPPAAPQAPPAPTPHIETSRVSLVI